MQLLALLPMLTVSLTSADALTLLSLKRMAQRYLPISPLMLGADLPFQLHLDLTAGESFDVEISFAMMLDGTGEVSNAGIAGFLFRDVRGNVSCLDDITNAGTAKSYMGLGHCGNSKGTWNKVTKVITFTYEDIQGMIAEGAEYNLTFDQSTAGGTYFLKDLNVRYYVEPVEEPNQGGEGTSKPEGTGDVLPVALIATVALASVALVVVSKKRKED